MMLVQKQPHFSMSLAQSPFLHTHRRHPSAPPQQVHVQPTRTPGLLSLSKPPRAKTDHRGSPKPRQAPPATRSPKPAEAEAVVALKPAAEIRGRGSETRVKPQGPTVASKKQRSSSQAAPTRRRQPSPDPFSSNPVAPAPPQPSKRRQLPIPVPAKASPNHPQVSHSDPVLSHMPRRKPQRTFTLDSWDKFPVCDDMTEAGSRPSTPTPRRRPDLTLATEPQTPPRRSRLPEPPRTAPISSTGAAPASFFPFPSTSTPNSSPKRRPAVAATTRRAKHLSEGVLPVFPADDPEMHAFIAALAKRRSRSSERLSDDPTALPDGYFASSQFQNSPSPDELPPPLFA
ncbi:hypothetical protein C8R43DRAFT_945803 [Mycena crocata]|nr:hypothetical protein C8R43DRAFT_945803 [Mycena crocata]